EVLARVDGRPVLVREGNLIAATFHPELTDDPRVYTLLLGGVWTGASSPRRSPRGGGGGCPGRPRYLHAPRADPRPGTTSTRRPSPLPEHPPGARRAAPAPRAARQGGR